MVQEERRRLLMLLKMTARNITSNIAISITLMLPSGLILWHTNVDLPIWETSELWNSLCRWSVATLERRSSGAEPLQCT